ncbi:MAG: M15 family metallopeptidase [Erysipelotrichaceae bacterium]|jgi:D-alanyl-D-alanine carboxypeptidase|nr:M15 family metallopeptidase [Erysipelotrichaceae bacterium]
MAKKTRRRLRWGRLLFISVVGILLVSGAVWTVMTLLHPAKKDDPQTEIANNDSGSQHEDPIETITPPNPFEGLYYYEADRLERYEAYQQKNPDLPVGDVVWQVNADIDLPLYEDVLTIDPSAVSLLVVNKHQCLPDTYIPANLVSLANGKLVTEETKTAFEAMVAAMQEDGMTINTNSAYRSYDYQVQLYNRYVSSYGQAEADTFSARPGHSEHQLGTTLDVYGSNGEYTLFGQTKEYQWVLENGYKFGFIIRYPEGSEALTGYKPEPWHLRYVGIEIATIMHDEGIQILEEYEVKYVDHKPQ